MRMTVNSDASLSKAIGTLREAYKEHRYFTLTVGTGKKRTVSQNSLSHLWYYQVSEETKDYTPGEVKALCKFNVGLPILRGVPVEERGKEVAELCEYCDKYLDYKPYEEKIANFHFLPCTSLMDTKQLGQYLTEVQMNYAKRNIILYFPDEWEEESKHDNK